MRGSARGKVQDEHLCLSEGPDLEANVGME